MIPLPSIRRLEAVGFRAFPSTTTYYNGTWAVRLTPGHSAKRLNSINPLDPADNGRLDERLLVIRSSFDACERPLVFRCTPLMPQSLVEALLERGWRRFDETVVMLAPLDGRSSQTRLIEPTEDISGWIDDLIRLGEADLGNRDSLNEIFAKIDGQLGLFSIRDKNGGPLSAVRCVNAFGMAGLFELVTQAERRGEGHASRVLSAALTWAKLNGARSAWLQVVAENKAAVGLYSSAGFEEAYRYFYLQAPGCFRQGG